MVSAIEELGLNAGRIWNTLNENGRLTEEELIAETCLRKNELSAAIGWLARENKISKDGEYFSLSDTNMTNDIGTAAGQIWQILDIEGRLNTEEISKQINIDSKTVHSAIGWLARENKISLEKTRKI